MKTPCLFFCMALCCACCLCPLLAANDNRIFYIAPNGNDANPGTQEAPFATLTRARDAIRELKKAAKDATEYSVYLESGIYPLKETFSLTAEDSGDSYKGTAAVLQGGITLPPPAFAAASSAPDASRIDAGSLPNILWTDLKALGIADYGAIPDQFIEPPNVPELFFNDKRMTLAQWPNEGWAEIATVVESGPAPWRNYESDKQGVFTYSGDRPSRWTNARSVWLQGYWCFDWASETIETAAIDPTAKTITLSKQHGYGIGSGNPAPRRYRAVNLLEELDQPGEYYIERTNGALYFWPPGDMTGANIALSTLSTPAISINGASNIMLSGFTIAACRGMGLEVKDGNNVSIENCTVFNTGLDGIAVSGGTQHSIDGCDIHDTGTAGLRIGGGDRATLTSCEHIASNNDIHHVSRRRLTHAYPVHMDGVGVRLSHNRLHDAPHQCIGLGGNNHIIDKNEIYNICMESDDCGAFYMGRNPSERGNIIWCNYWHDIGSSFAHGSCAIYFDDGAGGQKVYGNIFLRAAGGSFGAVFSHGGHDNTVENNIFIDCKLALGSVPWSDSSWNEWLAGDLWKQRLLTEVDVTGMTYRTRYHELKGFMDPVSKTRVNHARRNVFVRCGGDMNGNWVGENNWTTSDDPGFVDMNANDFTLREDAPLFRHVPGFEPIPFREIGKMMERTHQTRSNCKSECK